MKKIGDKVILIILRDGDEEKIKVKVGKESSQTSTSRKLHELLEGVQFESEQNQKGIRVVSIEPNSNVSYRGLRTGDIIVAVNKRRVFDLDSLENALSRNRSSVLLQINRVGGSLFLVIR
ncbi:hypothetical protein MACH09_46420 [Vibrio sp. MACH09]|uniref:PDZ domain-containing protein n=1 Tax=Vibrio sp. MACH09 TaxID=3025122 RepID=UPI00278F129F|nr:PDZ domain-containing protein [Vibrio sp. MACH09]GLO64134.1 hypothetical protein MACH09_46420 [Vibrio sp. MACH09]